MENIAHYADWIAKDEWDAHLTMRLNGIPPPQCPRRIINDVLRPIELLSGQKVAGFGVILPATRDEQPHAHYVIRFTRTVPDIAQLEARLLERPSQIVNHLNAVKITPYIYSKTAAYIGKHLLRPDATIEHYRKKLTKELLA